MSFYKVASHFKICFPMIPYHILTPWYLLSAEAECLDEIQTKSLRVFLLAIQSHPYSFALKFLFLQTHATSYGFHSEYTEKEKGEKPDRKHYPFTMI
jgi:hypothetical protein